MKIFAQVDNENNILSIIKADNAESAPYLLISGYPDKLIDITNSNKCNNFYEVARIYDQDNDSVLPAKVFPSWVLSGDKVSWTSPTPKPNGESIWDESQISWV
jgi:hypothetical protein